MALRIALPSMKQRRPEGAGYCTTLTANGITGHGHACGWPHIRLSGTVRPWSTSILLTMVRSKSSWITDCAMWPASFGWPITLGTGRGPQPSSATANSGAVRSEERRVGKECRSRCDWSSDVCSSDLDHRLRDVARQLWVADYLGHRARAPAFVGDSEFGRGEIGRASCRERV